MTGKSDAQLTQHRQHIIKLRAVAAVAIQKQQTAGAYVRQPFSLSLPSVDAQRGLSALLRL